MQALTGPADLRDAHRLADLEVVIERGKVAFIEVGEALLEIRDSRLYRLTHRTFEAYCQDRWGWSRGQGDKLIQAAEITNALGTSSPANQRQALELVPLKDRPEVLRSVWAGVIEEAEKTETPVTAPVIRAAVRDYIRGEAMTAEAEMQAAAGWMTAEEKHQVSPEMLRQRGELMRLIHDLNGLPDAAEYARLHGRHLGEGFVAEAMFACGWLETFCDALEKEAIK